MKQISTLLLALALPICASATVLMPKSGIITKSPVKSLIAVEASDFATNAVAKEDAADVTIKCTGEYSFEYYAESGDWYYGAVDDSETYVVKLDYITNSAEKSTGTFGLADLDTSYSGLLDYSSGSKVALTFKEGTTFTVNVEGSILTVTGTLVCSNGKTYKLESSHDVSDQDVDVSFSSDEATVTTEDGYLIVDAVNSAKEYFAIVINPNTNPNGVGTYEINSTLEAGTVQAGGISGTSVYPTFYGTLTNDDSLNIPLFLCTAGTVEVAFDDAGNIKLNVNATNTWAAHPRSKSTGRPASRTSPQTRQKASAKSSKTAASSSSKTDTNTTPSASK